MIVAVLLVTAFVRDQQLQDLVAAAALLGG